MPDNSNPFRLLKGNPDLEPVTSQTITLDYNKFNYEPGENWLIYLDGGIKHNAIIYQQTIDANGKLMFFPINSDRSWHSGTSIAYSRRIKLSETKSVMVRTGLNPALSKNEIAFRENISGVINFSMRPYVSLSLNLNNQVEWNNKYTFGYSVSKYDYPNLDNFSFHYHQLQSEMIMRVIPDFVFETVLDYNTYSIGVGDGRSGIIRLNSSLSYLFLKNEAAQLRFAAIDIFDQNASISRMITANQLTERQTSTLPRYFMLSLIYNIRSFRQQKVGGKDSLLYF